MRSANVLRDFLDWKALDVTLQTRKSYLRTLSEFLGFCGKTTDEIRPEDVHVYLSHLRDRGLGARTIAHRISELREFFAYLLREGLIARDPAINIASPKTWKVLPLSLPEADVKALLDCSIPAASSQYRHALALRDKAVCEVLYATGIRISELIGLKCLDVKLSERSLLVFGKGSKERLVPLGAKAVAALRAYLNYGRPMLKTRSSPHVFIGSQGRKLTKPTIGNILDAQGQRASIPHFTAHQLRHSCATHMLEHGADLRTIQTILGHEDIGTTEIYTHVTLVHLQNEARRHPRAKSIAIQPCAIERPKDDLEDDQGRPRKSIRSEAQKRTARNLRPRQPGS